MFSNLNQGNVLYGLSTKGDYKLFSAPITKVSSPYAGYVNNNGIQTPTMVVDITATINGEAQEFKQVPSNISIADFGPNSYVLADNKDSLRVHVESVLSNTKKLLENIEVYQDKFNKYNAIYEQLNPSISINNDNAVKELRGEVGDLKAQLNELITLIKSENANK